MARQFYEALVSYLWRVFLFWCTIFGKSLRDNFLSPNLKMLQRAGPANGHTRFIDSSLCSGRVLLFIRKHTENNHKILRVFPVLFLPPFWGGSLHPIRPSSPWPLTSWSIRSRACFHTSALWNKSNWSYVIKDFGTLPLIFSTSKYSR